MSFSLRTHKLAIMATALLAATGRLHQRPGAADRSAL